MLKRKKNALKVSAQIYSSFTNANSLYKRNNELVLSNENLQQGYQGAQGKRCRSAVM
jgi:hypothetical protein